MLREVLRLLGVDLDHKLAEIRAQVEEFKARTTRQITEQVKATGLIVGFAFVGAVAAIATFIIVLAALYRWVDMYKGPFAALAAVGAVMALQRQPCSCSLSGADLVSPRLPLWIGVRPLRRRHFRRHPNRCLPYCPLPCPLYLRMRPSSTL
jgi:hypothetical protein